MQSLNVLALFCEDIREEKDDIVTLIGIMPDVVKLDRIPIQMGHGGGKTRLLSKLCIYTRINFDPSLNMGIPEINLIMPDDSSVRLGDVDIELVQRARSEATEKGNLLAGLVLRATIGGFAPPDRGSIKIEVKINGETYIAGALRFEPVE